MKEPFGYFRPEPFGWIDCSKDDDGAIPLYEAPNPWEGLTENEIDEIASTGATREACIHAAIAKLKEKND